MMTLELSSVQFTASRRDDVESGLLGWLRFVLGRSVVIDGVTLRRTVHGRLALSFPSRRDSSGAEHTYVRPVDDKARRDIEHQVFTALGLETEAAT